MRTVCGLVCAVLVAGCGGGTSSPPPVPPAVFAAADLADGQGDRIVHRCAVCNLGMDGSPEHVSHYAGYAFHLCSNHCKETFDHDPEAVLRRLPSGALRLARCWRGKGWHERSWSAMLVPDEDTRACAPGHPPW